MYADKVSGTSSALLKALAANGAEHCVPVERFQATPQPIALLGVAFDNVTVKQTVAQIEAMIASRRPHYVVTANVDFLTQARNDLELQRILLDAPLVLCDGTPLVWASRLFGNTLPERVAGADLVPELIRVAAKKHYGVFFLGTTEEANKQAIERLQKQYPGLNVIHYSPPFSSLLEMDDEEIIRRIRLAKPDLLFVAFGCPKAEKWLAMHYRELGVPVSIGVGATIDFLAGRVKRAPRWMQRGGVEWIYRLCQEPRRLFKRYTADLGYFGGAVVRQWWTMSFRGRTKRNATRTSAVQTQSTWQRVEAASCLNNQSIAADAACWSEIARANRHCLLDLTSTRFMDSTGVALLIHLRKQLQWSGKHLVLLAPSKAVKSALKTMRLEEFFDVAGDALEAREIIEARANAQWACRGGDSTGPLIWSGEITRTNAEYVWQSTRDAMQRGKSATEARTIDLAGVRFMDSSGVKLLVRVTDSARSGGIRLRFSEPSAPVRNALRVSKLEHLLENFA